MTEYSIIKRGDEEIFTGQLELPIAIGAKGGVLESNPLYKNSFRMLGFPSTRSLAEIIVSVGLSQNFAALRAMAIEGIQKGHMNLHAKNIAMSVGIPHSLVSEAVEFMKSRGKISKDSANAYLEAIEVFSVLRNTQTQNESRQIKPLSIFYLEIPFASLEEPIVVNIAIECGRDKPVYFSIEKEEPQSTQKEEPDMIELRDAIFGKKDYEWLKFFTSELDLVRYTSDLKSLREQGLTRPIELSYKLKVVGILINVVTFNMIKLNFEKTREVLSLTRKKLKGEATHHALNKLLEKEEFVVRYGMSLLSELVTIFYYNIDQLLLSNELKKALFAEIIKITESALATHTLWEKANTKSGFDFEQFMLQRKKRMSATLMLLCDCILLKTVEFTPQLLEEVQGLGELYEIEGTMIRDISRWSSDKAVEDNLFTYWLLMKGKFMGGSHSSVQQEFVNEVQQYSQQKKDALFQKYGEKVRRTYENTSNLLRNHYRMRKSAAPKL